MAFLITVVLIQNTLINSRYSEPGAVQQAGSPMMSGLRLREDGTYELVGVNALPAISPTRLSRSLFVARMALLERGCGARGWRLNVADEISDSFIQKIRYAAAGQPTTQLMRSGRKQ